MFIYLSKKIKIAIPNPVPLQAISWNREYGWIACGGEDGVLKVLKLEGPHEQKEGDVPVSGSSNLTMNQTLEGHSGNVQCITWNEQYRKLTTSDQFGLIIVWVLHQGAWYEEMINNRNKSVVRCMKWNREGQSICIVYEDGAVIVGGVDGQRLWGNTLQLTLAKVEWAPSAKRILFGSVDGEVHQYSHKGMFEFKLQMECLEGMAGRADIAGIDWYNGAMGYCMEECPCLAIAYTNGRCQIMRDSRDPNPVLMDVMMDVVCIQWNSRGSILAFGGSQMIESGAEERKVNVVQFYTPLGDHLRTLRVPGQDFKGLSWEGGSLRLSLAVDHFIYFANVRPDYFWGYFASTVVYAFNKPNRIEHCVVFWDTKNFARNIKFVKKLLGVAAAGDHCVLATVADDQSGQYVLILCNAIGTPVDSRYIDIEPVFVDMSDTHIVAASRNCVYVWNYKTSKHVEGSSGKTKSRRDEKVFHIDDTPTGGKDDVTKFKKAFVETGDCVTCVCLSGKTLMVGRESGTLHQYSLPRVSLQMKHLLNCRPERIALNCDATRLAIIDISGVLTFFDPEVKRTDPETGELHYGEHIASFERKDVWNMKWSKDNPELFAMMERTYMYIFRDLDPEEPITSTGYICQFDDLRIRSVLLDEVMKDPERPTKDALRDRDIKSLRDTRVLLARDRVQISDVYSFIETNPHPRLWRLLAESALGKLDFEIAEKAFVRCQDYKGIAFVHRLQKLDDRRKQEAEVAALLHQNFEEAEGMFLDMDRRDLAMNMRIKLGDWFRVVQLLRTGAGGNDKLLRRAWNAIGDYYADRQRYKKAVKFFVQGDNQQRLAECYYRLEDYRALEEMVFSLPSGSPLLQEIAQMFATVGLCKQAVDAYTKTGMIKESIGVCVSLNQWDLGVQLAKQHNVSEIDALLAKYAKHLLVKNSHFEAIELYRKANHFLDAAKLLFNLAESETEAAASPVRVKKLYVLAALQVEAYHSQQRGGSDSARSALDGLLAEDTQSQIQTKMIDTAWRGAEAYHLLLLAQRQLYKGDYRAALKTAVRLTEYDDLLDPVQAYSILALAAVASKSYGICSKAFIKLESLTTFTEKQRAAYEDLALQIFTKHPPKDGACGQINCSQCEHANPDWATSCASCETGFLFSVVTGRPMVDLEYWLCDSCKHRASESEITPLNTCPLCHAQI
eukprot:m.484856 g.484856  ORF g.484856 m.484856 type:complete len:1179 (-) comp23570_c0_seq1:94-3630(-)